MADARSKAPIFQIRSKSNKLQIVNPSTGEAVQVPPQIKAGVDGTSSATTQPIIFDPAVSKNRPKSIQTSKRFARKAPKVAEGPPKTLVNLPSSNGVKSKVKPAVNGDTMVETSKVQTPPILSKRGQGPLAEPLPESEEDEKRVLRDTDESQWKPDIYAHAYIPEAFLAVNKSPAILLSSTPVNAIDFVSYTASFAAPLFLPSMVSPQAPSFDGALPVDSIDNLSIENYEQHLSDCLVLDLEAQIPEIRTYDMFGVQLSVMDRTQELYSLHVPGLRENTPRVVYGDNVMVRQLVMDPATKLPLAAPASGSTGYQISAVVVGVDRPKESLNLRINGCTPHLLICNVSFIVQTRWIKSLQRAVGTMAAELNASSKENSLIVPENQSRESSASPPGFDFGPIGTPIRSPPARSRNDYFGSATAPLKSPSVPRHDYFGAVGTPLRSPQIERPDYFGSMVSPGLGHLRQPSMNDSKLRPLKASHIDSPSLPNHYRNQAWLRRMLYPDESDGILQRSLPQGVFKRSWFDRHLNHEQKKAVDAILDRKFGSVPFVINGPPGTGKTKTMVETITQLAFDSSVDGTILVCAPSDSAADTLALRLMSHFEPKVMFRLNDFSRTFAEVPQKLLPYCYVQDDIFNLPPLPELMACKVIIATSRATDVLVQARVTNKDLVTLENKMAEIFNPQVAAKRRKGRVCHLHWAALLVDEAAQATEPEMLIPLSVVTPPMDCDSEPNPLFIMAGDQHQLGPRIYNNTTTLGISLFERLSNRSMYASHPLARRHYNRSSPHAQMLRPAFVNLVRNYRSHPAILAIPSALFYANTLIPEASNTEELETWTGWGGQGWPVLFACNGGIDDCEDIQIVGGGWFNIREARKALSCAKRLLDSGHIEQQDEICIMSPFRAQVNVLRKMARKAGLWSLNIGPMDAFQGLESRFVILCTTRARIRFLDEDTMKGAGIVNEPKKFNVAITRAKQGLMVIGNPWVLDQDPHWKAFLRFCWRNELWQAETDEPDDRMTEAKEDSVNEWNPGDDARTAVVGLEKALIYKERQLAEHGSKAVRRFMSETGEDEVWRLGRLAEEETLQGYDE